MISSDSPYEVNDMYYGDVKKLADDNFWNLLTATLMMMKKFLRD